MSTFSLVGSGRSERLFVALDLPWFMQEKLFSLHEDLRGFTWKTPGLFHLTLKFIGSVEQGQEERILDALSGIEVRQFILSLQGLGTFTNRGKPWVIWAAPSKVPPVLFQLQKRIDDALFNIGIPPEKHVYRPHVTIARCREAAPETVRQFIKRHAEFETAPFRVEDFVLFRSEQFGTRRHYTEVESWQLAA